MRRQLSILLLITLAINAHVQTQGMPEPVTFVETEVQKFKADERIPGIAVAFYYNNTPYFFNYGQANGWSQVSEHTLFEMASITKTFTSTLLAYQVVKGLMDLNGNLAQYIPYLKDHSSTLSTVTVKQLATHTSSLVRDPQYNWNSKQKVLNALLSWLPEFPIGSKLRYSNIGYDILGFALEDYAHKNYESLLADIITGPLQMSETAINVPVPLRLYYAEGHNTEGRPVPHTKVDDFQASGAIISSSTDMMKYLTANLGITGPIDLQDAMKLTHVGHFQAPNMVQALGWQRMLREEVFFLEKNGGLDGFSTWMGMIPDKKIGIVLLANRRCDDLTPFGRTLLIHAAKALPK